MSRRDTIKNNLDIIARKLVILRDNIHIMDISKGQETFINMYIELIDEYTGKAIDILDRKKYHEAVESLSDDEESFG